MSLAVICRKSSAKMNGLTEMQGGGREQDVQDSSLQQTVIEREQREDTRNKHRRKYF